MTNAAAVNIMAFYSATIFTQAQASERSALFFSWGFGLTNFVQVAVQSHAPVSGEADIS